MKKLVSLLLALCILLGMATAIADEKTTMEFWIAGNDDSLYGAYEKVIAKYNETHPDIVINMSMIAWSEYFTKLSASFVGGTAPDVYAAGFGQFYTISGNGNMLDLTPYIPADWDGYGDIPDNVLDIGRLDGGIHALLVPEGRALYYRKDIAAENGVTEEDLKIEKLEDLIELAKKMTIKEGNEVIVEGLDLNTLASQNPEQQLYLFSMMNGASWLYNEDLSANFTNAEWTSAMEKVKALLDEGYAIPASAGINYFDTDVAAMTINNETSIEGSSISAITGLGGEVGAVNLPQSVLLGQWYAVNTDSKIPAEAADFLLYLFSVEAETMLFNEVGQYPSRASLKDLYCGDNELRKVYAKAVEESVAYGPVPNKGFLTWVVSLRNSVEAILNGTASIADALNTALSNYNATCGL